MNPDAESALDQSDWALAHDEAADFLGGGAPAVAEDDLADFLTTERPDSPSGGPGRWFHSRYDGSCDGCGAYFTEGEEIRADGEGGWQGRECCGELEDEITPDMVRAAHEVTACDNGKYSADVVTAAEQLLAESARLEQRKAERAARPKSVEIKVPLESGRYVMPHPTDVVTRGKNKGARKRYSGQRMTTFVKLAGDSFKLTEWQLRSAIVGLTASDEVRKDVAALMEGANDLRALVKAEWRALNALAARAKDAAGASDRSRHGTILHKYTEELDAGTRTLEQVPELYRRDAQAYAEALARYGYRPVQGLIERTTTVLALGIMGTFDRVLQRIADGAYVIGDTKSGANALTYSQLEIAAQLAGYARGFNETGVAQWDGVGNHTKWESWGWARPVDADGNEIRVREDFAVVMHVPFGSGECELYRVNLEEGRRELAACELVRERHKVKGALTPLELPEEVTDGHDDSAAPITAAAEPHHGDMLAVVAEELSRPPEPTWEQRFAAITTREQGSALYRLAAADLQGIDPARLRELARIGLEAVAGTPPF